MDFDLMKVNQHVLKALSVLSAMSSKMCLNHGIPYAMLLEQVKYQLPRLRNLRSMMKKSVHMLHRVGLVKLLSNGNYALPERMVYSAAVADAAKYEESSEESEDIIGSDGNKLKPMLYRNVMDNSLQNLRSLQAKLNTNASADSDDMSRLCNMFCSDQDTNKMDIGVEDSQESDETVSTTKLSHYSDVMDRNSKVNKFRRRQCKQCGRNGQSCKANQWKYMNLDRYIKVMMHKLSNIRRTLKYQTTGCCHSHQEKLNRCSKRRRLRNRRQPTAGQHDKKAHLVLSHETDVGSNEESNTQVIRKPNKRKFNGEDNPQLSALSGSDAINDDFLVQHANLFDDDTPCTSQQAAVILMIRPQVEAAQNIILTDCQSNINSEKIEENSDKNPATQTNDNTTDVNAKAPYDML